MQPCSNQYPCSCKHIGCARHGKCCACVNYHREKGQLPSCLRAVAAEKKRVAAREKGVVLP